MAYYPDLQFKVDILPTPEVTMGILSGQYDFGFITGEKLTPEMRFEKFSGEIYSCVGTNEGLFEPLKSKNSDSLRLISFPGWELFFSTWMKTNGLMGRFKTETPRPTLHVGTLAGAIHAIKEGAGLAILPRHCLSNELDSGELVEFRTKNENASCPIYLCVKLRAKPVYRVELIMALLKKAKRDLK